MTTAQNAAGPTKGAKLPPAAKTAALRKGNATNDKKASTLAPEKEEAKHDNRFLSISTATYVEAIKSSIGFSRSALQLELAVNLSVFANMGNSGLKGRAEAMKIYEAAGFSVDPKKGTDYKSVRRHIQVAAELFDKVGGKKVVDGWTVATNEMQSIQAIAQHLEEYSFKSFNSVLSFMDTTDGPAAKRATGKHGGKRTKAVAATPGAAKAEAPAPEQPKVQEPTGDAPQAERQPSEEDKALMAEMGVTAGHTRRREDSAEKDCITISTASLHVAIPFGTDPTEIMELAMSLMNYVQKSGAVLGKSTQKLNS